VGFFAVNNPVPCTISSSFTISQITNIYGSPVLPGSGLKQRKHRNIARAEGSPPAPGHTPALSSWHWCQPGPCPRTPEPSILGTSPVYFPIPPPPIPTLALLPACCCSSQTQPLSQYRRMRDEQGLVDEIGPRAVSKIWLHTEWSGNCMAIIFADKPPPHLFNIMNCMESSAVMKAFEFQPSRPHGHP
jgi:hypothetical protein